jgi:hypothetical protein
MSPDSRICRSFLAKEQNHRNNQRCDWCIIERVSREEALEKRKFSLMIDMTTDIETKHLGALVVIYYDEETKGIVSKFWRNLD